MHGKDQDFGARQASADLAGGLGAVDDRHRVVQQHDVRLRLERLADGLFAITSLANDGPPGLRLQDAAEARTHHFMVVCDENSGHRFFPRTYCRTSTPLRASVETRVRANGKCRYRGTGAPDLEKARAKAPARFCIAPLQTAGALEMANSNGKVTRAALVHRHDDVHPGAARAGPNPEVAAELIDTRLDAADANTRTKIRAIAFHGPRCAVAVVRYHHVNTVGDPTQLDRYV